ncbi:DUF3040 domain-containing protein [Streptomyces sp. SP17BM10]|uniref:DUF3040 domain-containing protein n=1 Tax=Streptomyces sp. SP17BM10 TaxID=3002530 RepID=UPI002E77BAE9|nr:DUF3040 domain-containing protein [Streptomyces sp. SP17BM10]MEE1783523.1 DUF3040 domain-containing protein [Streptomyces sp. SP17BM10]
MDGQGLSHRELRILAEMEDELRADGRLDRALRTTRRGPGRLLVRVPAAVLAVLLSLSAGLALVSADANSPDVLAAFSVVWVPTFVLSVARLVAWRRGVRPRRSGR